MKILWAKSGGLLPLDSGGRIRSYHIATELARRHAVSAFTFYSALTPDPHVGFREPFADIEYVPLELAERGSVPDLLSFAANALTLKPYQMRKYCGPQVQAKLRQNLERGRCTTCCCATSCSPPPPSLGLPHPQDHLHAQRRSGDLAAALRGQRQPAVAPHGVARVQGVGARRTRLHRTGRSRADGLR